MKTDPWTTSITEILPNQVRLRGHDIADLMGNMSFGAAVYLILKGKKPSDQVAQLVDAILVSSIDHGATPPSALAARTAASTGAPLGSCVAAGLLHINQFHGGAIEECARQLGHILSQVEDKDGDGELDGVATAVVEEMKASGKRLSGFGHRIHKHDPRAARLFELAEQAGVKGQHIEAARAVERVFQSAGKNLPINVDGAIGAILADLGFEPQVMNGFFMMARLPGLVAHAIEEKKTQRPMRKIDPVDHVYDGRSASQNESIDSNNF